MLALLDTHHDGIGDVVVASRVGRDRLREECVLCASPQPLLQTMDRVEV